MSGRTPAPTTTRSQSKLRPLSVSTELTRPSPSKALTDSPPTKVTPCASSPSWKKRPASSPKVRESATSSTATIVQAVPLAASEAATSAAM